MATPENPPAKPHISATWSLSPPTYSLSATSSSLSLPSELPNLQLELTSHHGAPVTILTDSTSPQWMVRNGTALIISDAADDSVVVDQVKRKPCRIPPSMRTPVSLDDATVSKLVTLYPGRPVTLSAPFAVRFKKKKGREDANVSGVLPSASAPGSTTAATCTPMPTWENAVPVLRGPEGGQDEQHQPQVNRTPPTTTVAQKKEEGDTAGLPLEPPSSPPLRPGNEYKVTLSGNRHLPWDQIRWWDYGTKDELLERGLNGRQVKFGSHPLGSIGVDSSAIEPIYFTCTQ